MIIRSSQLHIIICIILSTIYLDISSTTKLESADELTKLSLTPTTPPSVKSPSGRLTDSWAVEVKGDESDAKVLAVKYGLTFVRHVVGPYYLFRTPTSRKYRKGNSMGSLADEPLVGQLQQQIERRRVHRSTVTSNSTEMRGLLLNRPKRSTFSDPGWNQQWYLALDSGHDINVQRVWDRGGYTGKNVVVSLLDDGVEIAHPDLVNNVDISACRDFIDDDNDPTPSYSGTFEHGTNCAGVVASQGNNHHCGVGVAYNAKIGGARMMEDSSTDANEASSLLFNNQHIHIYSASWGPDDDGKELSGPGMMTTMALEEGARNGRGGKGSIFVWAGGNGAESGDMCSCDGYVNSIYTLAVSATSESNNVTQYAEACSSILVAAYSDGSDTEKKIYTTSLFKKCTDKFGGTSAAAPIVTGVIALMLEANPELNWRDVQHVIVHCANSIDLDTPDWRTNGAGLRISNHFGYGLIDAVAAIDWALKWQTVPEQHTCQVDSEILKRFVPPNSTLGLLLITSACAFDSTRKVVYLEHLQIRMRLMATVRGEISLSLVSPMGTTSTLLTRRRGDLSEDGFLDWVFMTTHLFGELARGSYFLVVNTGDTSADIFDWGLVIWGTATHPQPRAVGRTGFSILYEPDSSATTLIFNRVIAFALLVYLF